MLTRNLRRMTVLLLALAVSAPLAAQEKQTKKRPDRARKAPSVVRVPKSIELTEAQKEQVAALNKEYAPKVADLQKQARGILTDEQNKARAEVIQSFRKEGKSADRQSRQAIQKALAEAVQLTEAQKKQQQDLRAAQRALNQEVTQKFQEILTDEQKATIREEAAKARAERRKKATGSGAKRPVGKKPASGAKPNKVKPADKAAGKKPVKKSDA